MLRGQYEPVTSELRDTEQIPLPLRAASTFIRRGIAPRTRMPGLTMKRRGSAAKSASTATSTKPQPLRLSEIRADIVAVNKETEGLLAEIIGDLSEKPKAGGRR